MYSQAPPQASRAWFRASGFAFPRVAFSKSTNILCVSVARADAARPRIETFLPRRNDSQASRPASLSDNRLSHTTEHFKMPFPKNTKKHLQKPTSYHSSLPRWVVFAVAEITFMHEAEMETTTTILRTA